MAMLDRKPANVGPILASDYLKTNGFRWLLVEGRSDGVLRMAGSITNRWRNPRVVKIEAPKPGYLLYSLAD